VCALLVFSFKLCRWSKVKVEECACSLLHISIFTMAGRADTNPVILPSAKLAGIMLWATAANPSTAVGNY
jgi:hypothetical protein